MIAWLLGFFFLLLFLGFPVAFSMGIVSSGFFVIQGYSLEQLVQRLVSGANSFPLLALPFFLLAGEIMGRGGITRRLIRLANCIVGNVRGGIAMTSVISSTLFGTISGSAPATAFAIGSVVVPEMKRTGYGKGFISTILGSSGTLGLIIPPSIAMIILGVTGGISIGKLFLSGFIPGLVLMIFLCVFSYLISAKRGYGSTEFKVENFNQFLKILADALLPLITPIIILGGIFLGVMTPTEASVVAVLYGFILAFLVYRELNIKTFLEILINTAISSASIMFIISVASAFGWVLTIESIPEKISAFFLRFADTSIEFLIVMSFILLLLGCITEVISLIVLLTPIFLPIALEYGVDPIHFGIVMMINFCVAGTTPPVGLSLLAGVRVTDPNLGIENTLPDVIYVVLVMLLVTILIILFPVLGTFLPNLLM